MLVTVIVFVVVLAGLGSSMLQVDLSISKSRRTETASQLAYFAAEAGIDEAFVLLRSRLVDPAEGETVTVGDEASPRILAGSRYWAEVTRIDAWRFRVVSTGTCQAERKRQECVLTTAPDGFFQYAAYGRDGMQLGDGARTDSFDPSLGSYASQVARGNGDVGSGGDLTLGAGVRVHGDALTAEGGAIVEGGAGVVVTGDRGSLDEGMTFPPVEPPAVSSSGPLEVDVDTTIGPGLVGFDDVATEGGATLTIEGPAQIVMRDFQLSGGSTLAIDTSNGPVEIYGSGDWDVSSDSTIRTTSESAREFQLFLSQGTDSDGDPTTVQLNANSALRAAIYAPEATVTVPDDVHLYGSIIAGNLSVGAGAQLHFDESLLYDSDAEVLALDTLLWRPVSADHEVSETTPGS